MASVLQTASAIRMPKIAASAQNCVHSSHNSAGAEQLLSLVRTRCGGIAASGTMVLDRRSLSYAALGLGPSWMLLDGARCVEINQCVGCSDDFTNAP